MKLLIVIPTKDGGEGFQDLMNSIQRNIEFVKKELEDIQFKVVFAINGNPDKPLRYLQNLKSDVDYNVFISTKEGKVAAALEVIKSNNIDYVISLDDDIKFESNLFYESIQCIQKNVDIKIVAAVNKCVELEKALFLRKFIYDIINVRSLNQLFLGKDPFLFGRFFMLKSTDYQVPGDIMLEDLYLNMLYINKIKILNNKIYYKGVDSLYKHAKRVLMLEAGRKQIRLIDPEKYELLQRINKRTIDEDKLRSLSFYDKICYRMYGIIRFFTNKVLNKIFRHRRIFW